MPLDKREGSVKGEIVLCSTGAPLALPEKVEDQGSGNLTLNHLPVEDRSTNHRFGPYIDHDSSMRGSRRRAGTKAAFDLFFIANKCDGHHRHLITHRRQWDRPVVVGRSVPVIKGGVETAPKLFSALCFENTSQEGPRRWG